MIDWRWITTTWTDVLMVLLSLSVIYAAIIGYTRLTGLRSFSKISASDFAMTVAVGSLFGSSISNPSPSLALAAVALAGLFAGQWFIALLRRRFTGTMKLTDNAPLLLMDGPHLLEKNLNRAHVTEADVLAKLREANVLRFDQVRAVVFETTGDISVLHSDQEDIEVEGRLLRGVLR